MGDRLHAVLCAAGYNLRWLLRMITKTGLRALYWLLPAEMRIAVQRIPTTEAVS
jgi:IS5 family transposase